MRNGLSGYSAEVIQRELHRKQGRARDLQRRRAALVAQIERLDREIRAVSDIPVRASGRRARNSLTLIQSLHKVLTGKSMRVTEAVEAVKKAGYKTNSNNFRVQVNIALMKGPFKRTGRGVYTAR